MTHQPCVGKVLPTQGDRLTLRTMKNIKLGLLFCVTALLVGSGFWMLHPTNCGVPEKLSAQQITIPAPANVAASRRDARTNTENRRRVQAFLEKTRQMADAYSQGGFKELERRSRDSFLKECEPYLLSLGLSQGDAPIIADMLYLKNLQLLDLAPSRTDKPKGSLDWKDPNLPMLHAMDEELNSFVGNETAAKIKIWNDSRLDRNRAQDFRLHLESQLMSLSQAQEQAIANALYAERKARTAFDISLSSIPRTDKVRYIRDVTHRVFTVMDNSQKRELQRFLEEIADRKLTTAGQ